MTKRRQRKRTGAPRSGGTRPQNPRQTAPDLPATGVPPGPERRVVLKIRRQDAPGRRDTLRWETFEVTAFARMSVVDALRQIQRDPVTTRGVRVAPVAFECGCLEEKCGACALVIDGRARLGCSTFIEDLSRPSRPIVLEPLSKFPVMRDLVVDRSRIDDGLKQVRAWLELDGLAPQGPGPRQSVEQRAEQYSLDRCISCGCCLEACPQYGDHSEFLGAAAINQVRVLATHPTGRLQKRVRIQALMGPGGIARCGNAQNCVDVCPAQIPLVDSIQVLARESTRELLFGWLLR